MTDALGVSDLANLKHDGWSTDPPRSTGPAESSTRSPELDDRIARLQARGRASSSRPKPPARRQPPMPPSPERPGRPVDSHEREGADEAASATVTFLKPPDEEPQPSEQTTTILDLEPAGDSRWLPGVATSMPSWRPNWSISRTVATGASAVSFAAMVVAMGPLFEGAGDGETPTGGDPASGDPAPASSGEQPAPAPSVAIQTAVVDPATAALLPPADGVPATGPAPDPQATADQTNPAVDLPPAQAAAATTAPPATAAPAPAPAAGDGTPQATAAPQTAAPATPAPPAAPTAAPTTAAPATPAPTAAPATAAPTTAPPTAPAPTQPPTTAAPATPPPSSGGSG